MKKRASSVVLAAFAATVLAFVPAALASVNGKPGGGGRGTCTQKTPAVLVDNNWAWASPGSYGLPGQQLTYAIDVVNYDSGCAGSTFAVSLSAPSGFSVSPATSTITLKAGTSGYVWATVTSPTGAAPGDYALTATATRGAQTVSTTSWYKLYTSDNVAPTLAWPSPSDGSTISGRSWTVSVSASDDHAVKKIELSLDNVLVSTTACDDISYSCELHYAWSTSRGPHTATFRAYDWIGNVAISTSTFIVG